MTVILGWAEFTVILPSRLHWALISQIVCQHSQLLLHLYWKFMQPPRHFAFEYHVIFHTIPHTLRMGTCQKKNPLVTKIWTHMTTTWREARLNGYDVTSLPFFTPRAGAPGRHYEVSPRVTAHGHTRPPNVLCHRTRIISKNQQQQKLFIPATRGLTAKITGKAKRR